MTALREPCAAGILFAVAIEADAFERLATNRVETRAAGLVIHEGTVAGARVAWCIGGVGTAAATQAARLLVAGHRPGLLVSAGFAGGLDPALARGAVVRPAEAVADGDARRFPLSTVAAAAGAPLTIVTAGGIVATPAAKHALAARSSAQLCDMETIAVAGVAAAAGLPCAGVRVISDTVDDELPREVANLAHPQSTMRRLGAALNAVGRRPRAALDLWRLYEHAVVDAKTLAAALEVLCRSLAKNEK
jgi:adenosylhomocysteine nucleosidase